MLAYDGVVLLGLHLFRMQTLVLVSGVEVACASRRNQTNLFTHDLLLKPLRRGRACP